MKNSLLCFLLLPWVLFSQEGKSINERVSTFEDASKHDTIRAVAIEDICWEYIYTDLDSALYYSKIHIAFAQKLKSKKWLADAYNTAGVIYSEQGDLKPSIANFVKSADIYQKLGLKKYLPGVKNNLGRTYLQLKQYEKSKENFESAIEICLELKDTLKLLEVYVNYGGYFREVSAYPQSIKYYMKSLEIARKLEHLYGISIVETNLAATYDLMGEDSLALHWYERCLISAKNAGDIQSEMSTYNNLGIRYNVKKEYKKALEYCRKSKAMAFEIGVLSAEYYACYCLAESFAGLKQYDSAYYYLSIRADLNDSMVSVSNIEEITTMQMEFSFHKERVEDSLFQVKQSELKEIEHQASLEVEEKKRYLLYGGICVILIIAFLIIRGQKRKMKDNQIIVSQKDAIEFQRDELMIKNSEIMDSISYAKRIQSAILPPKKLVKEFFPNSFILYKPKDIVAGDFYWMEHSEDTVLFAVADCTGHGVPGAMVSVVCNNGLNRSVREHKITDPGKILDKTREIVIQEFEKSEEEVKDGMDIALIALTKTKVSNSEEISIIQLKYSGANNPLWIIRKDSAEIEEIKADKQPIGKFLNPKPYTTHHIELNSGDAVYIFTDGYSDQFGGIKGKKYKSANFKRLLLSIQHESMENYNTPQN